MSVIPNEDKILPCPCGKIRYTLHYINIINTLHYILEVSVTKKLGLSRSSLLDIFHSGVDRTKRSKQKIKNLKNSIKEVILEFTAVLKAQ